MVTALDAMVDAASTSGTPDADVWQHALGPATTRLEAATTAGSLSEQYAAARGLRAALADARARWALLATSRRSFVDRLDDTCVVLHELPIICAQPEDSGCIRRDRTLVRDFTEQQGDAVVYAADELVRYVVVFNIPRGGTVEVASLGDDRQSPVVIVNMAAGAVGLGGGVPTPPEASPGRTITGERPTRVIRVRTRGAEVLRVRLDEPGLRRTFRYRTEPHGDWAFGAAVGVELIGQTEDGPFGNVVNTGETTRLWQPAGLGDPRAGEHNFRLVPAFTVHAFVGRRYNRGLIALEAPIASTRGNPFRGLGIRLGFGPRFGFTYFSWSFGFRVEQRALLVLDEAGGYRERGQTRAFAGYLSVGVALDLREGAAAFANALAGADN